MNRLARKSFVWTRAAVVLVPIVGSARSKTLLHEYQNLGFWVL